MKHNGGFRDWIIQRVTAVLIGFYSVFLITYFVVSAPLSYIAWQMLFDSIWMKGITLIVLLCILWHAWIGLWTVLTDYVKPRIWRFLLEIIVILSLVFYLAWGFNILFG